MIISENSDYANAIELAKKHYENFPVVSVFTPKKLRKSISLIYWFARTADDFADEGDLEPQTRLSLLEMFENDFAQSFKAKSGNVLFEKLNDEIISNQLNKKYFFDLLSAFKQDVTKKRYNNFEDVLDYCNRSANPVGRLILELYNIKDENVFYLSDKICTALQLTNFYQDTLIDIKRGRLYYPLNELAEFNVSEKSFELLENNYNIKSVIKFNIDRAQKLFDEGKKILDFLPSRLKFQIRMTITGGETILSKIKKSDYNVFFYRPKLNKIDLLKIFFRSLINV